MLRLISSRTGLLVAAVCCLAVAAPKVRAASTPISFVQTAFATPQTPATTVNIGYPAAQTAGDMNVVVVGWNDTTAMIQTVKDNVGNSYKLAIGPTSGTALRQSIYYAPNIVAGVNTVTVTFNQPASYPDVRVFEYQGVTTLDVTAGASGNSASASSGAASTTGPNELIVGASMVATATQTAGSGFTSRVITSPDGDIAADKIAATAGSNSATAILSSAGPWVMQMVAFSAGSPAVHPLVVSSPTVSGVSPNSGSTTGGMPVTITGANFAATASVTFGSTAAAKVVVVNSTTIQATTPGGSAGTVAVTVTNSRGRSARVANGFTYNPPIPLPTVSHVSPGSGPTTGRTAVTITGTNFAAGAVVMFGGAAATSVAVVNSTTITAVTPAGSAGAVTVMVTNPGSRSGSLGSVFTYTAPAVLPAPVFSVASGTYVTPQTVGISDSARGTTIYYTANGTTPTTSSTKYTGAIAVSATETLKAIAVETGFTNSAVASATYTINPVLATPVFSVAAGTYASAQTVTISDSTAGTTIYYTTNGTTPTTSSTKYTGAIAVSATETLKAIAVETGFTNSAVASAIYTINPVLPPPVFSVASGTYTTSQTVAISDSATGVTIYYTTNNTTPTTSSTKYTGAIAVSTTETLKAMGVKSGFADSAVALATYTINEQREVSLTWNAPSGSPDPIEGYNIYRSPTGTSQFQRINSSVDIQTIYVDSSVQNGMTYDYIVKSVDYFGVESVPSNQVAVTVP